MMKKLATVFLVLCLLSPAASFAQSSWKKLSREERETLQRKYQEWKRLPDSEKAIVEENYKRWRDLPNYEKQELQKRWRFWQELPKDRRDSLKQQFQKRYRGSRRGKQNR